MKSLFSCFSSAIADGLQLEEQLKQSEQSPRAADKYGDILNKLERARQCALEAHKREADIDLAMFAIAAWIDEITARFAAFLAVTPPLQATRFGTRNAGKEFFTKLQMLTADQDEVREIYYVILSLGFKGQYSEHEYESELTRLKDLHARQLPVRPAAVHTLAEERLTPQPYEMSDPPGPKIPTDWDEWALRIILALSILVPMGLFVFFASRPELTQVAVDRLIAGFECADLVGKVDPPGTLTVTGWVRRLEDIERLRADVVRIEGLQKVRAEDVQVRIWPYCEVVALLKPLVQRNEQNKMGLGITPAPGQSKRYVEGEKMVVRVQQTSTSSAYLSVDYYALDGNVVHMLPSAREPNSRHQLPAGIILSVGEQATEAWYVRPPFGQELVTVIASAETLLPSTPVEVEDAKSYLAKLRSVLEANKNNSSLVADYMFVQTEAR